MLTAWLIHRRDTAADSWLKKRETTGMQRHTFRLALWDTLLSIWTRNGTRRA